MCAPQSKFCKPAARSRLDALTQGSLTLESYKYLGLATVVEQDDGDGVDLTYLTQSGDVGTGDGGDQYRGLDRFGRVVDQRWIMPGTGGSFTTVDRFIYTFDRHGNVLSKEDRVAVEVPYSLSAFAENFTYSAMNQLVLASGYPRTEFQMTTRTRLRWIVCCAFFVLSALVFGVAATARRDQLTTAWMKGDLSGDLSGVRFTDPISALDCRVTDPDSLAFLTRALKRQRVATTGTYAGAVEFRLKDGRIVNCYAFINASPLMLCLSDMRADGLYGIDFAAEPVPPALTQAFENILAAKRVYAAKLNAAH